MAKPYLSSLIFECSLGHILLAEGEQGLRAVVLGAKGTPDSLRQEVSESLCIQVLDVSSPSLVKASHQIDSYLQGERELFSFDVDIQGTPFQRRVWESLCRIPYGETRSYQDIANTLGRPTAVRAVANACGQNPLPLVIPCHRVIASDGGLGGFSAGIELKRRLLNLERGAATHLPLIMVAEEESDRIEREKERGEVLDLMPQHLADWLRLLLNDDDVSTDVQAMTPEAWLADVLERLDRRSIARLTKMVADYLAETESKILRQITEELVAAGLTLTLTEAPSSEEVGPLLRAAASIDSPFYEVACRRLLSRTNTSRPLIDQVSEILREVLDGSLEVSKRTRNRSVDLWVLVEERQPASVWAAPSSDDPSAVYAALGLWREALVMAENSLALGHQDPALLLNRISELHEKLGEFHEAHAATLRLVALAPSLEAKQRLRELADKLKDRDSHSDKK